MAQCIAITSNGTQCSRVVRNGVTRCFQHQAMYDQQNHANVQNVQNTQNPHANFLETQHRLFLEAQHRAQQDAERLRQLADRNAINALVRHHMRIAGVVDARLRHEYGQRRVHEDRENVHRLDVRNTQQEILNVLARKTPLPLKETLRMYANAPSRIQRFLPFLKRRDTTFDYILETARANPEYFMTAKNSDGTSRILDLSDALNLVVHGIFTAPVEHQPALRERLAEEVRESKDRCVAGCYARILNTFSGFEEVVLGIPPVDPRSLNERLGDLFAALAKREINDEAKRAEGMRILSENGVIGEAQTTWLDAL